MKIYILQYEGLSLASRAIKLITWGTYSHSAIGNSTGNVIEAWQRGGVSQAYSPWVNHKLKTPVAIYSLDTSEFQDKAIWEYALRKCGFKYDWRALLGFLPAFRFLWRDSPTKWFCSHLVAHCCQMGSCSLFSQETPLYKISPTILTWSSKTKFIGQATNITEYLHITKS